MSAQKKNYASTIAYCLISIMVAVVTFSGYKVYSIQHGYNQAKEAYDSISEQYTSVAETKVEENDDESEEIEINKVKPTIQMMKNVDFDKLRSEVNPDIVAWINCPDTVIDYPVVQGKDNEHYLYYNVNGSYSSSGTIFLEAQNYSDFTDRNSIMHGHHMQNGSMFATLDKWQNQAYYEEHPYFTLSTALGGDFQMDVVAAFNVNDTDDVYRYEFYGDQDFSDWITYVLTQSKIKSNAWVDYTDKFAVLSTCAYDGGPERRSVLVLRLVPMA